MNNSSCSCDPTINIQVTHGKQKIASIQGFVSQEREKYEKMVSI